MKQSFNLDMRFFLLLLAAASACDEECVGAIYEKIISVPAEAGWKDADMAVYGYMLYMGATESAKAGGTLEQGFAVVDLALDEIAKKCDKTLQTITRDMMAECIEGADQAGVDEVQADLEKAAKTYVGMETEAQGWFEGIVGTVANQLAPGSVAAAQWDGLSASEYETALKVYFIVGEFWGKIIPAIEAAFAENEAIEGGLMEKCFMAVSAAVGYTQGGDLAAAIANKGEDAFGTAGLQHADCFGPNGDGGAAVVPAGGLVYTPNTGNANEESVTLAVDGVVTALQEDFDAGVAQVAKFKDEQPGAEKKVEDEASPAAVLSAAVALLAMML
jgi:hypothetical protein